MWNQPVIGTPVAEAAPSLRPAPVERFNAGMVEATSPPMGGGSPGMMGPSGPVQTMNMRATNPMTAAPPPTLNGLSQGWSNLARGVQSQMAAGQERQAVQDKQAAAGFMPSNPNFYGR